MWADSLDRTSQIQIYYEMHGVYMSIIRSIVIGVAGTGLAASVAASLGGFDNTTRDDDGQITNGGEISIFNVQVGDCLKDGDLANLETQGSVSESVGVPCTEPHKYEVFGEKIVSDLDSFSRVAVISEAEEFCLSSFQSYIGVAYKDSLLEFTYLFPTEDSWANGDKEITCLVESGSNEMLNVSVRNSGL